MNFLSKIKRRNGDNDDDDLDLEDEPDPEDAGEVEDPSRGGLLGKLFGRLKRDGGDTEDMDGNEDDTPRSDEDSPVQTVRLEGVVDVRPVGPATDAMTPPGDPADSGAATEAVAPSGSQSAAPVPAAPDAGTPPRASPEDSSQEGEAVPEEDSGGSAAGGLEFSLSDIFEEAATVDEYLKDLADSQEDIRAEDLAGELRELLTDLERGR